MCVCVCVCVLLLIGKLTFQSNDIFIIFLPGIQILYLKTKQLLMCGIYDYGNIYFTSVKVSQSKVYGFKKSNIMIFCLQYIYIYMCVCVCVCVCVRVRACVRV